MPRRDALRCVDLWDELQQLVQPDVFEIQKAWPAAMENPQVIGVVSALYRSLWTQSPGCEPKNAEAKRQILFFCNSLFNKTLSKPPRVAQMKSWSAFTPHYAEDVTYCIQPPHDHIRSSPRSSPALDPTPTSPHPDPPHPHPHPNPHPSYSMKALHEETGGDGRISGSLQALLTSLFPEEFAHFCERVGVLPTTTIFSKERVQTQTDPDPDPQTAVHSKGPEPMLHP